MSKIKYRKIPGKIVASVMLIALMGAGAAQLLVEKTAEYEGYVPETYDDGFGNLTICFGNTKGVRRGQTKTFEECVKMLNSEIYEHAAPVFDCVPDLTNQPDGVKAAFVSMAYNIGVTGFCASSVADYAREGSWERACKRIGEIYKYATDKRTGKKVLVKGLENRRNYESNLCLEGLRGVEK